MSYEVKLEVFEGPLDLLLHLIKKNEINIYDIPIALITQHYLEYIDLMKTLNLEIAGEFLVMAATLVQIKSKMLLPPDETAEEEEVEDPRLELMRRLLEYQRYKEAAEEMEKRETLWRDVFSRTERPQFEDEEETAEPVLLDVNLFDLINAFKKVLEKAPKEEPLELEQDNISIKDKMATITERLEGVESLTFDSLFDGEKNRASLIATFLALLELIRLRLVRIQQLEEFGVIRIFAL